MIRWTLTLAAAAILSTLAFVQTPPAAQRAALREADEEAFRHNNIGVARLEQYDYAGAITSFRAALERRASLATARLNLAIALLYEGQLDEAAKEADAAAASLPNAPQPAFVRGLIARAAGRLDDAAAAFQTVVTLDAADVGSRVQLGQVRATERRFTDAAALFEAALEREPFNATAAYGLAMAFTRNGDRERGEKELARFERLRDNPAAITYSTTYLEQGRYGEAIVSTGLEPELIDDTLPKVTFADVTSAVVPDAPSAANGILLADADDDGDADLWVASDGGVALFRNQEGRFAAATRVVTRAAESALAGDYDNDGVRDLLVLGAGGAALYRGGPAAEFRDVSSESLPAGMAPARAAAFADVDHDGDLDIIVGARLLRNNGTGRFQDVTADARLTGIGAVAAIAPIDVDNRRDLDLLMVADGSRAVLFSNQRDGTFRDVAREIGMPDGAYAAVTVADVNKDMLPDFFFGGTAAAGVLALSQPSGRYTLSDGPPGSRAVGVAQFVDYDNDGLPDLLAITAEGTRLWRWLGKGWGDVTSTALPAALTGAADPATALAVADLDGDGDEDVVVRRTSGVVRVYRNDGGNANGSIRVRLTARVSNRDAVGAKVELRAGSLRHRIETISATPAVAPADVLFGLGSRPRADVVRVLWPSGTLQAETDVPPRNAVILELDRKPSSCPFLYTWNGARFGFVTDFLGGGEMGSWVAPGIRNVPDPDEYVRIAGDQLRERAGRYELRITNELEEALFLDRLELLAVAHPQGVEVYPNEGLRSARVPLVIYSTRGARPPASATDEHGHDVLDRIALRDNLSVDDFRLSPIQGYADEHAVTIDVGTIAPEQRVLLLLTGWTDYAFSSDNVAAQQAGLQSAPPALEAETSAGQWEVVRPEIGLPVGRPQTVVVDVTSQTRRGARRFRIGTTLRVYWDQVAVDTSAPIATTVSRIAPRVADLRWRGFSRELATGRFSLPSYDYDTVTMASTWKRFPGRYTRYGDVASLLASADDQFVVASPGDEIAVSFDALPSLPDGWTRTFLLYADGFSKEMNLHSASPDVLAPLPFHAMTRYPYAPPEQYPDTPAHRRYRDTFNTRAITRTMPPLEIAR